MGNIQYLPLGISSPVLSNTVIPRWLVAPLEEAMGIGGTTTASAMRATPPRVATMNNLHDAPIVNLRQKINEGPEARLVIEARRKDRIDRYQDDDDSDRFPAFTTSITHKSYPKDFKPVGIPKYDSKQDPRQWIHCYSITIEVSG
jgi:hypothetical protein